MTPESQRIAIAEACGWNITNGFLAKGDTPFVYVGEIATTWSDLDHHDISVIPDYLNSLDAMHEAEKVLDGYHRLPYLVLLQEHCFPTAAQRAEAFLRTLGLWKD